MRLIDADELRVYWLYNGLNEKIYDTNDVLESIDEQPTIDPESLRPTAKWSLGRIEDHIVMNFICGNCGKRSELNYYYCPKCGARMIKNDKGW